MVDVNDIIRLIDHTELKPTAQSKDIEKLCEDAEKYGVASVCVNPCYVNLAKSHDVKVSCVIDFPLGAGTPEQKRMLTKEAIKYGADEIDMVLDISALKSKDINKVEVGVNAVVGAAEKKPVKVIMETCYLTETEIAFVCRMLNDTYINRRTELYAKTSTGFGKAEPNGLYVWNRAVGATLEAVKLLNELLRKEIGIKAAGGISTKEDAEKYIEIVGERKFRIGSSSLLKNLIELL